MGRGFRGGLLLQTQIVCFSNVFCYIHMIFFIVTFIKEQTLIRRVVSNLPDVSLTLGQMLASGKCLILHVTVK
ncbi:MAG: hypothetical protein CL607_06555 [Anaerolineaceae bacterium]|nr:hypothetical protein [Anaerolineaceae bacterium]